MKYIKHPEYFLHAGKEQDHLSSGILTLFSSSIIFMEARFSFPHKKTLDLMEIQLKIPENSL